MTSSKSGVRKTTSRNLDLSFIATRSPRRVAFLSFYRRNAMTHFDQFSPDDIFPDEPNDTERPEPSRHIKSRYLAYGGGMDDDGNPTAVSDEVAALLTVAHAVFDLKKAILRIGENAK